MNTRGPRPLALRRSIMADAAEYGVDLCAGTGDAFTMSHAHCLITQTPYPLPPSDCTVVVLTGERSYMVLEWSTICNLVSIAGRLPSRVTKGRAETGPLTPESAAHTARNHGLSAGTGGGELRLGALKVSLHSYDGSIPQGVDILVARPERTIYGLLDYVVGCKLLAIAGIGALPRRDAPPKYVGWREHGEWVWMSRETYRRRYIESDIPEDQRPAIEWLCDTREECAEAARYLAGRPYVVEGTDVEPAHETPRMRPCPTCRTMVLSTTKERLCPACLRHGADVHDAQPDYEYVGNVYPGGTYR